MKSWRLAACAALFVTLGATLASAQPAAPSASPGLTGPFQGTPEEEKACQRDAVRFCKDAVPDTFRVLSCLQANRSKISKGCRAVLAAHGQ